MRSVMLLPWLMLLLATPRKRLRAVRQPSLELAVPKGARAAGAALVMPRAALNTLSHSALLSVPRRGAESQKVLRTPCRRRVLSLLLSSSWPLIS